MRFSPLTLFVFAATSAHSAFAADDKERDSAELVAPTADSEGQDPYPRRLGGKKGKKKSKKKKKKKSKKNRCKKLEPLPINEHDFHEPDWETIIERAFPPWAVPENGCPRLDLVGGTLLDDYSEFPTPEEGKFNPCYYTKAFAGLDPMRGGYPTPIDTHYPYEFAAPFLGQPGDGSVHHCPVGSDGDATDIGGPDCPKLGQCPDEGDCAVVSDEYGIGHVPPFVALAAVKNSYQACEPKNLCHEWFDYEASGCNIKKCALDRLVLDYFGTELDDGTTAVKFQPPVLIDGHPSNTYYRLEYGGEQPACTDGICRGPHYCSADVDGEPIWGDFCPYVHTGENSGLYRHPHVALAALELWIANQCMPHQCPSTWLDSPNGKNYGMDPKTSTSITWAEMKDNTDPISQPKVPYEWPNQDGLDGANIFPGLDLYDGKNVKPAQGMYVTEYVAA